MARWTGRDRALRNFARLPQALRDAVADETLKRANMLAKKIFARAPYDPTPDGTAHLRDTIRVYPGGSPTSDKRKVDPQLTVDVEEGGRAKGTEYARFVEFGHGDTPPQPHFYPTYRLEKANIKRAIRRAIRKVVSETIGK